jgi:hypothetical protein
MNDTGSYTARKNAKRAGEKLIANGKAPAVDYAIWPRDDGRFEIIWKRPGLHRPPRKSKPSSRQRLRRSPTADEPIQLQTRARSMRNPSIPANREVLTRPPPRSQGPKRNQSRRRPSHSTTRSRPALG